MASISQLAKQIRATNAAHGFESKVTEDNPAMFSEKMLLVISEISEALEEWRNHHEVNEVYYPDKDGKLVHPRVAIQQKMKPEGIPVEIADAIIRLLDFCEANGIDIQQVIEEKMAYNETRPYKHGGKRV